MIISPLSPGMLKPDGTINPAALQIVLNEFRNALLTLWASGTSAPTDQRPHDPVLGQIFYDTALVPPALIVCKAVRVGATPPTWALV